MTIIKLLQGIKKSEFWQKTGVYYNRSPVKNPENDNIQSGKDWSGQFPEGTMVSYLTVIQE